MEVYLEAVLYSCLVCLCCAQLDLSDPCSRTAIQLHNGDIAYFPSHITLANSEDESAGDTRKKKAATSENSRLWPDGRVYYTVSPLYSAEERGTIQSAMQHWESNTCIRFIPRSANNLDYINLFPGSGCCSYIGRIGAGGVQGVSVGRSCFTFANVIHEIGHVVGFWHEQSRPDRDEYVDILDWNIRRGYEINFLRLPPSLINSQGVGYDYNSIMHYNRNYFSVDYASRDTLRAKDPAIPIGQAVALSELDIIQANRLYNCDAENPPALSVIIPEIPLEPTFPSVPYSCVEYHQNLTGTIQSPAYPEYSHNTQCAWLIKVPPGYELFVEFRVDMEYSPGCTKDYLRVWENLDQSDDYLEFCGRNFPYRYTLENTAYIYYHTDSYNTQSYSTRVRGFSVTYSSTDINECLNTPCSFGCLNLAGSYECYCRDGFYLSADGRTCFDVNECALGNGGCTHTCVNRAAYFYCTCDAGYTLDEDRRTCRTFDSSCNYLNGGCQHDCIQETDSRTCACYQGYQLDGNGHSCHDVNECYGTSNTCDQYCHNTEGSFYCTCRSAFTLHSNGYNCTPEYSCAIDNGGCNHICRDTSNGGQCSCMSNGYTLNGRTCEDIDECANPRTCQHSCVNTDGSYHCLCQAGYGLHSNGYSCQNIDECALGTDACDTVARCYDSTGSYFCVCPYGYTQGAEGHSCDDVDECSLGSNLCAHECVNTAGSYHCICPPGYTLFDYTVCIDTNECIDQNSGCQEICTNTEGSYMCSCSTQGYTLAADGSSCTDEEPPSPPATITTPASSESSPPSTASLPPSPSTDDVPPSTSLPPSPSTDDVPPSASLPPSPSTDDVPPSTSLPPSPSTDDVAPSTSLPPSPSTDDPPATFNSQPAAPTTSFPTTASFTQTPSSSASTTQTPPTISTTTTPSAASLPLPCGGHMTSTRGFFHSPNWPMTYPINTTCEWNITLPDVNRVILITFNTATYSIGCLSDSLLVLDGFENDAISYGPYCSVDAPDPIKTTSNTARILFTAGRKHTRSKKGFYATYNSRSSNDSATTTTVSQCGSGNLTASNGSFSSPNWPETYPTNTDCEWIIELPDASKAINISFNSEIYSFPGTPTNCNLKKDWVAIMDGLGESDLRIGPFCYTVAPDSIITSTHVAKVIFHSGSRHDKKRKGFRITYQPADTS